jgi:hypothetical protein
MKKLLILTVAALMLGGCVVYPGYDYGYYDYPYPYAYGGPSVDLVFTNFHGGHYHHGYHGGFHGGYHGGFRH